MEQRSRTTGLGAWSRSTGLTVRRQLWSAVGAVGALVGLTLVLDLGRDRVSLTIVFLIYLAAVVVVSAVGGSIVGTATAIVAFLLVNFYFTEPRHTLDVADTERLAELIIFLVVGGTVAALGDTATRRRQVIDVRTSEAAELAAANDLRTALLRAVSHDLRTPLTTAKLATSSLRASDVELGPDERAELLVLADEQVDRLVTIVENLLDASRLQAGAITVDIEPVRIADVVESTTGALRVGRRLTSSIPADLPTVPADVALLERVLGNLVSNALAADPTGAVDVVAAASGQHVDLSVVDHGPGLTGDQIEIVTRPFHRLEDSGGAGGIGLGLPICLGFCEAMGVGVHFSETAGGGLTVTLRWPIGGSP